MQIYNSEDLRSETTAETTETAAKIGPSGVCTGRQWTRMVQRAQPAHKCCRRRPGCRPFSALVGMAEPLCAAVSNHISNCYPASPPSRPLSAPSGWARVDSVSAHGRRPPMPGRRSPLVIRQFQVELESGKGSNLQSRWPGALVAAGPGRPPTSGLPPGLRPLQSPWVTRRSRAHGIESSRRGLGTSGRP